MSFVVTHEEMGIYLGSCSGIDFWSNGDTVGMDSAIVFQCEREALDHLHTINCAPDLINFVEVEADLQEGRFASVEACEQAGIEAWECEEDIQDNDSDPT